MNRWLLIAAFACAGCATTPAARQQLFVQGNAAARTTAPRGPDGGTRLDAPVPRGLAGGAVRKQPSGRISLPRAKDATQAIVQVAPRASLLLDRSAAASLTAKSTPPVTKPVVPQTPVATQPVAATALSQVRWESAGKSVGQRPIEVLRVGRGPKHALITASLSGNEADSSVGVEELAKYLLANEPRFADWTVLLVRSPNPDGLADGTMTNARGVSLSRNFPSSTFTVTRTTETGATAASEPETQVLVNLLADFRPDRVVHLRSGTGEKPLVLVNERAADGLRKWIDKAAVNAGVFEAFKSGSLEEYVSEQMRTEMWLVSLPLQSDGWVSRPQELASLVMETTAAEPPREAPVAAKQPVTKPPVTPTPKGAEPPRDVVQQDDLFAPYKPPVAFTGKLESDRPRGAKGYVELLPPPPEFSEPGKGWDSKYYELPPPG